MNKINPFRPNSPVAPGMFVGRINEVELLENALFQTRAGQVSNFIITGERGIGKTSLLNYIRYVAQGDLKVDGENLKFLVVDVDIEPNTTQLGLIKKIELSLDKQLSKTETARSILRDAWNFLSRIEAAGVSIKSENTLLLDELLLDELSYSLAEIVERTCNAPGSETIFCAKYDGILILIDEADNASPSLNLGSFLKLLLERLQRRGCDKLMIGMAGLPELRGVLLESHPSSLRLFDELVLSRLSPDEVNRVLDICIEKANDDNIAKTKIAAKAREFLIKLSEGYPHFIQQFGYSAFAKDDDGLIDNNDVVDSAFGPRGALEKIGDRYYRDNFYNKIQKDSYRQVLRIMADELDGWVKKSYIKKKFRGKDSTLDNALKALRDRHIIFSKEGERGIYRLQHKGFALWIKLYASHDSTSQ